MTVTITSHCFMCGRLTTVTCDESAWEKYENGALAQEAFPDMDIHTRETIISGMCLPCQEKFFEAMDENEDECDGECDVCCDFDCPSNASLFAPQDEE